MAEEYFGEVLAKKYPWACFHDSDSIYAECDEGWYSLIDQCLGEIQNWYSSTANPEQMPTVTQIKEKFGGLRIYLSWGSEEVSAILDKYENLSLSICEFCGATNASIHHRGHWLKTVCPDCAAKERWEEGRNVVKR